MSIRYYVVVLFVLSLMMLYADANLVAPMLVKLKGEGMIIGTEANYYFYAGLLGTIPVLSGILTTFIWGYLADKLSRKRLFALAVLAGEVPCFLTGFARNYYELLVLRALTGIGINGAAPVARAIVADIFPPESRGKGYALYNFSTALGTMLGMIMAGVAISLGVSWRIPFMLAAAPNFALIPLFLLTVKEIKIGYAEPEIRKLYDMGAEYKYRIKLGDFLAAIAATPTLIFIYLQGIPGMFPWGAIPFWAPTYFQEKWGLSPATSTLIVFAAGFGMLVGYFIGGVLSDKLLMKGFARARLAIPFIGILIGTLTTALLLGYPYPYGDESLSALLPVIIMGLLGMTFVTFAAPNVPAILSEISVPEHRGTIFGIFNITDNIGSAIGPTLAGALMAYFKDRGAGEPENLFLGLLTVSLLWIPCALLWLPAFRTYVRDKRKAREILAKRAEAS